MVDEDPKKLKLDELLTQAASADSLDAIKKYLEEIERRKKIFRPNLLRLVADRVWHLAEDSNLKSDTESSEIPPMHIPHWPTTEDFLRGYYGDPLNVDDFKPYSGLWMCGYEVGKHYGLPRDKRRDILANFFQHPLHPKIIERFGNEYCEPKTMDRLMKMAHLLASTCVLRKKRRDANSYAVAIAHYEDDLDFLYIHYYLPMSKGGPFDPWPKT